MTLAETTRSRTHRSRSVTDVMWDLDVWMLVRLGVWVAFCVLLLVLA